MIEGDKGPSIFKALDEQFMLKQSGSDDKLYEAIFARISQMYTGLVKKPANDKYTTTKFAISHFAGDVTYTVTDFVEKNKDSQNDIITKTLAECKHPIVNTIYADKV